ncbi:MAG: AAA family ATPase [Candidatus Izemoplasmatales bacterium]
MESRRIIYVLIGPPAIGKSTWVKNNTDPNNTIVISRDNIVELVADSVGWTYEDMFVHPPKDLNIGEYDSKYGAVIHAPKDMSWANSVFEKVMLANNAVKEIFSNAAKKAKSSSKNVVVDLTNMKISDRMQILSDVSRPNDIKVAVIFNFKGKDKILKAIAKKRADSYKRTGKTKEIPDFVIDKMISSFQYPSPQEGYDKIIYSDTIPQLKKIAGLQEIESQPLNKSVVPYFKSNATNIYGNNLLSETYKNRIQELAGIKTPKANLDKYIYHGTNNNAVYHIQRHGAMKLNAAGNNEPYISFTSNKQVADYYATMKGGNHKKAVLRTKKTPDFLLSPKFKNNKEHEWITTKEVPTSEIEIETIHGWIPLENWDIIDKSIISEDTLPSMYSMLKKYKLRYPKTNTLIVVNIDKLLNRHKTDAPDYAFDTRDSSNYPRRVDRAKEYWLNYAEDQRPISPKDGQRQNSGVMKFEAPYVGIWNGKMGFVDGRHRVVAMKELGYDNIVIEVPKSQKSQFENLK